MSILSSSFARNTLALMAAGVAILIAIAAFSFVLVSETREHAREVEAGRSIRIAASSILSVLLDAETGQRGYLLTAREDYIHPFDIARQRLPSALGELRQRAGDAPDIGRKIGRLDERDSSQNDRA